MRKSLVLGIVASFFFAFTFVLNRQMNISGGSWIWSSSLRYIFMLPILFLILIIKNQLKVVLKDIIEKPISWILWSTVGFGLFYASISFASVFGPSWLIAGTWQITIVAGAILTPLFYKTVQTENGKLRVRNKIPVKALFMSFIILLGISFMQLQEAKEMPILKAFTGISLVVVAAFSYPLGNRKMMEICNNKFNTIQRVFGMTLCSMPFWIIMSIIGFTSTGLPQKMQIFQSLIVAICSGVIATILFFRATDLANGDTHKLAVIESTQSGEVLFTVLGGVFIFNDKVPTLIGLIGIALVILGMILNSLISNPKTSSSEWKDISN